MIGVMNYVIFSRRSKTIWVVPGDQPGETRTICGKMQRFNPMFYSPAYQSGVKSSSHCPYFAYDGWAFYAITVATGLTLNYFHLSER